MKQKKPSVAVIFNFEELNIKIFKRRIQEKEGRITKVLQGSIEHSRKKNKDIVLQMC